ncbi:MAG TPA: amidase [Anaerolineales bacterium]|nr:amidase [Anaerolineales bacterium]
MNQVELVRAFRADELPVTNYISQIESYFSIREPSVLAFIPEENRFGRLHKEAESLLSRFPDPAKRPPLFGMLAGVKDIFHAGGFTTQAGSRLPSNELQGLEAESVTKLKNAGALILGKTVTTEFAYFFPGLTRNPNNPEHTPGGSSSGSAAAVGAGLCLLALGTQTIGSLIRPAAFCGTVALKPTYDRISRNGVIPLSQSLDHIGFFAPNISTAKQVAPCIYKNWEDSIALEGKPTLGIPDGDYLNCASTEALACFNAICDSLSDAGYELRRVQVMDDYQEIRARHDVIMSAEAAHVHDNWFKKHENLYSSKFTELIKRGQSITDSRLKSALESRDKFRDEITQTMIASSIDVWIAPSAVGPAPKGLESTGDPIMNLPWTQIGFPAINIPTGKNKAGLPMGLQVVGKWQQDESLLAWGEGIEKVVSKP